MLGFSPISSRPISASLTVATADTGRSGYWRLNLVKMQEEALRRDKEALQVAIAEAVAKVEKKPKPVVAEKPREKLEPLVPLEEFPEVNFQRKPMFLPPKPSTALQDFVAGITDKTQQMYAEFFPLWQQMQEAIKQRIERARDTDYRVRFLLLMSD